VLENSIIQFAVLTALVFWREEAEKTAGGGGQNTEQIRTSSWTILINNAQELMTHQAHPISKSQDHH